MYTIPENYKTELQQYRKMVSQTTNNEIDPLEFKIYRVVRGIYEQRTSGKFMIRIRCSGGIISPEQLLGAAQIAKDYNSLVIHITTRQEIQIHNLKLTDTPSIMEKLLEIGLTTKGSGGNTVRNIIASVDAGIGTNEVFDISPYQIGLTNFLIARESSFNMPRKLKIAFSNSDEDNSLAAFNDLGFIAKIQNGQKGFKVYIGGSPSVKPMVGYVLFDFIPVNDIIGVALAVVDLFHRYGNRKNRHKARLRYVFYKYGKEKVFAFFNEIYNQYKTLDHESFNIKSKPSQTNNTITPEIVTDKYFDKWLKNYVTPQKQKGIFSVTIPIPYGNMTPQQAIGVANIAIEWGEDSLRFSRRQNIHLRHIPKDYLDNVYSRLQQNDINTNEARIIGNLVSCTGADTCQLGICFSKGGFKAINEKLATNSNINELPPININISGCPNACGQHLVADLGFAGKVSRNEKIYPAYSIFAGTIIKDGQATLPKLLGEVAAKDIADFTNDILNLYAEINKRQPFHQFISENQDSISNIVEKYKTIPSYEDDKKYYIDLGNNDLFTLAARGTGECSAGLLDLIEGELRIIQKCNESMQGQQEIEEQTILLNESIYAATRLLGYISKQQQLPAQEGLKLAKEHWAAMVGFNNIETPIFDWVTEGNFIKLISNKEKVMEFTNKATSYYKNLGDNLQPQQILKEITPTELQSLLHNKIPIQLIDVREDWEKEMADIGGELIPLGEINKAFDKFTADKQTIIYCRTGRRSAEAIKQIENKLGLTNLYNLQGGIHAWADAIDNSIQKY
ncbi:MAG: rhodanese-like domain-containing protein [Salinivirgaceae bacterium]|jgi:sulfite reductase (ferredoxin)|nr:rhodanese-like domain-containing protein [Salinivirgaceae bacterium]